ncbi:MAG: DUF3662 and FHA domain-containing protein [Atopobiaceae bacterium]|nr:DUF3662 and FHA domain-containing protein [Atopobiaceae bacterium]
MNFLNVFEQRVGSIFGDAGPVMPFSFKKLAKQVAREMESETFVIHDIDTAPALYTILVSPDDDGIMRPLYAQISKETAQFVEGQAQNKGYSFVGKPLVRFMVDPGLRSGKFAVFAENIDTQTLNQLRAEEEAFLSGASLGVIQPIEEIIAQPSSQPQTIRRETASAAPRTDEGLPFQNFDEALQDFDAVPQTFDAIPQNQTPQVLPLNDFSALNTDEAGLARLAPLKEEDEAAAEQSNPSFDPAAQADPSLVPENSCMLIDRESGRTYTVVAPSTIIGRERNVGGIVLRDPNISRRHAEISYDGAVWRVTDLNSTNGTLVNDVDVAEAVLHDGDQITFGLIVLEFREN